MIERTLVLIKPDAVRRGLIGEIIARFERKGFLILGLKMLHMNGALADKHYEEHVEKDFYPRLRAFITSGPSIAILLEGEDCIALVRNMMGALKPEEAQSGSIRGDFATHLTENVIHGSDSAERANRETLLFFKPDEIFHPTRT
jgi:nucleoside-diphosphate kinase